MELFEYNDAPDEILQKGLDHKSAKVHEAAWRADYHKRSQEEEDERKKKEKEERDRNSYIAPLSYYSYFY